MEPYISVIITVYNMKEYISKCLDSVLPQTLKNIEIIIVDDGSDDGSENICDIYKKDIRVKIIHKNNGGLVEARKTGIQYATSSLVTWVDGDDWIESDFLEKLYNKYIATNADMIVTSISFDIGDSQSLLSGGFPPGIYDAKDLFPRMLYFGEFYTYGILPHLCSKLVKKDKLIPFLNELDNKISIGEDAAVCYPYIINSDKICVYDISGYHYVQHINSMNKKRTENEEELLTRLFNHLKKYLSITDSNYEKQLIQYEKYHVMMRLIENDTEPILKAFKKKEQWNNIILYGAGGIGQKLYSYISEKNISVTAWIDKNDKFYKQQGFDVVNPDVINFRKISVDAVLIANMNIHTAKSIKDYLLKRGCPNGKIKWFSDEWLSADYMCNILLKR